MDLWQLNVFCKVIESGSFSKAAEKVHLSQPTISGHIKELEGHFNCRLIDRLAKQAAPTAAGELLYKHAHRLILLREKMEADMAEFQGLLKGRLMIGGSTIPGNHILPKVVGAFKKEYPDVTVSLIIGDSRRIVQDTLDGRIELGVVGADMRMRYLVQDRLTEDRMRLIVPRDHLLARADVIGFEDLTAHPFILRETGSGTLKSMQAAFAAAGRSIEDLNVVAEMGSTQAVIQAIRSNIGISILSTIAVADDIENQVLVDLEIQGLNLIRHFFLCRHQKRSLSPMARMFSDYLISSFQI